MPTELVSRLADSWFGTAILVYAGALFIQYTVLNLLALSEIGRQRRQLRLADRLGLFESDLAPPISLILPLRDRAGTAVEYVRSLMRLRYPAFEIVVVNDGSEDGTLRALTDAFGLRPVHRTPRTQAPRERIRGVHGSRHYPFLTVVDLERGGRGQALNLALAFCRHPLFLVLEPDTWLERDTLLSLALPFYEDASVLVTGGVVRPANGCRIENGALAGTGLSKHPLVRFQVVEYLRQLLSGRLGWTRLDSLFFLPGSLGLFSRAAVQAVGGFRTDTAGEDMELVMRIQRWAARRRQGFQVRFVGGAVAWTRVPETLREVGRQRARWHQALAQALWLNPDLLFNTRFAPHHGIAYFAQLFFELSSPAVELCGLLLAVALVLAGRATAAFPVVFLALFVVGGTLTSLMSIGLERLSCPRLRVRELEAVSIYALLENFGYRQFIAVWRLKGLFDAALGRRVPEATRRAPRHSVEAGEDRQHAA